MHSSHTGWSSPTGSHSVIRRRAQRSAGRQPLHTTQSFSRIGMAAECSPKVAHKGPKEGLSMKGARSMLDCRPTLNCRPSIPSTYEPLHRDRQRHGHKKDILPACCLTIHSHHHPCIT